MLYLIVWTAYEFPEAQGTSTSAVLKSHRPSKTMHTRGHFDRSKLDRVDDVEPRSWIYTATQAPLKTQEHKATQDTQEAISGWCEWMLHVWDYGNAWKHSRVLVYQRLSCWPQRHARRKGRHLCIYIYICIYIERERDSNLYAHLMMVMRPNPPSL